MPHTDIPRSSPSCGKVLVPPYRSAQQRETNGRMTPGQSQMKTILRRGHGLEHCGSFCELSFILNIKTTLVDTNHKIHLLLFPSDSSKSGNKLDVGDITLRNKL